jgi:hypothetical protein
MRFFTIKSGTHKGKHLHVTRYVKKADGVEIKIEHNVPTVAGKEIQWVQTTASNAAVVKVCKMLIRVDPFGNWDPSVHKVSLPGVPGVCKADDLLPFYWTAADLAAGSGPGFSDGPSDRDPPKTGRIWNRFITALTEVTGKNVYHLVAITWGYDRMADGSVREDVIRTPTTTEMREHGGALKRMYPDFKYT